ncbi:MAG TPA: endolytic transglycosylase MltG [Candidatus Paceibacterota bacterium]
MFTNTDYSLQKQKYITCFFVGLFVLGCIYLFLHKPPKDFPLGEIVTIQSGESLQQISNNLRDAHVIAYPFVFRAHVIVQGGEKKVQAGGYLLDRAEGPADLAYRLVHGQFHLETVKITIPEGWNVFQIGDYLTKTLIKFDKKSFLALAKGKEGYLFPDTYFVSPTAKPKDIVNLMQNNFDEKIVVISGMASSTHKLGEIITMASILENEARTTDSRRIIAGILWKRLSLGMPLQVDSTFSYINGKNTYDLTADDLKIDSSYNTYLYKGLPPTPISNPGIDAITSSITPITTKYLYFLSSKSGVMYYARTFDEHVRNKMLYLNK